ncbi:regulation of enolase protein 1 (concanavalin A-like superfamily) [Streptomyces filamentosus]
MPLDGSPSLPLSLPLGLEWVTAPASWGFADDVLTVTAGARTDLFTDPLDGGERRDAAVALALPPGGDWQFAARLRVGFADAWDAGGLLVHAGDAHWAKLTFERAPDGAPGVYSVVTRGRSDDAIAGPVAEEALWLRISRTGARFAFHSSRDGRSWSLVRQFALDAPAGALRVGVIAQSPVGEGCRADFDGLRLSPTTLPHLFDGR